MGKSWATMGRFEWEIIEPMMDFPAIHGCLPVGTQKRWLGCHFSLLELMEISTDGKSNSIEV
jgi:hypothetical protein